MKPKTYKATLERDEDGVWCGVVKLGPKNSAISDGPTIERARARLREAVALSLDCDESEVEIEIDPKLPEEAEEAVATAKAKGREAVEASLSAELASANAAAVLNRMGLSRRDTGDLLGLTRQRASQIGTAPYLLDEKQEQVVVKILKTHGVPSAVRFSFVRVAKTYPNAIRSGDGELPHNRAVWSIDLGGKAFGIDESQYEGISRALKKAGIPMAPSAADRMDDLE
jgi:predicted RNase H-like HicB family nuclease